MSDFKRLPKSKTSCPLKPWLVDFIFNHDSNQNVTANAVKIIENICEDKNGNMTKLVTDGSVYIKANITHQSIQTCMQENDDDMPPWDKALILMRKYSLSFQPKTELENCEFILIVDEFKLWDLQTGSDFKKTLHPCSYIAKVKMKIREYWQKWRESVVSVNEEPSIGGSMGSQLLSLLAEMGQQTQPEDSQPDQPQSTIDNDNLASKSDAKSSVDSTEFPPVIYGPTLIADNSSVSDSQKLPFLQYIDNDRDISHPKTPPESQSQQYEFSSLSEVSLEFSCESSDDSGAENKMTSKSSKNDSTKQIMNTSVDVVGESSVSVGTNKAEIPGKVDNNVEASGSDDIFLTVGEENSIPCENNNKVVFCGTENGSELCENDKEKTKSKFDSGQLNSKDFLHSYVTYLKNCSSKYDQSTSKQCNNGQNNTDNSKTDIPTNGCVANDYEKSVGIQTIPDIDDKALQDCSESHIYTDLVETDYDSIQWWSSAEDSTCLSDEDGNTSPEKNSEHDKNHTHKTSKSDKNNKNVKQNLEENYSSELKKKSECTKEPENKNTPERDKLPECNSTSEPSDNFTDVEDHVYGTQPFFVNNSEEIMDSIGDTTCVELNYKQNVSEILKHDNENELSGMQPLVSQSERNSDSVSTREPSDEILNSNSNNSNCEIIHKSDSSCYEISEFESKNSSDSTKNIVKPVKSDDSKSGNLSIIYQSTQKTASEKEVPLFPISPIRITDQPSTSKGKPNQDKPSKESVESLVFDTEYEEELRLRELAKADPKTKIKSNEKSISKCVTNDKSVCENPINEEGTRNGAIQKENVDISDKSLFNSDKASNSDIFLIQAAQSAEKRFPQEKQLNYSKSKNVHTSVILNPSTISPKPLNFEQTEKEIIDEDQKNVEPSQKKNPVQKSISDSNSSESVIIIGSSESTTTNSDESRYSQNVISLHTSPRKKHHSPKAKKKTKAKVLAHDTEPYIIDESQDIPTSEVNNSILNRSPKCKASTSAFPQTDDFVIILSDLSDTSSEEREEPNRQTNQKLKDVLHERLKKRKRKLSNSVEIGEPSSKRTQCIPEHQVVCVDVHVSQNENVKKRKTAGIVSDTRRSSNEKVTTKCDKGISLEKCENVSRNAKKSNATSDKQCDNGLQTDNCEHLRSNNYQPRSKSSRSNMEINQPSSSNSRSNIEIDQPRSSNSRSNIEIDQPRSSNSTSDIEIDQPRSSKCRSNIAIDQPRSSNSRANVEIDKPRLSNRRSDQPRSSNDRFNIEIDQPRSSSRSNIEIDQPSSSNGRPTSDIEIDQPWSSNSRSIIEIDQPRSSNIRSDIEIDQPRSSNSRFNLEIDQPRSSKSRSNMEIHQPRSSSSRSLKENDRPRSGNSRSDMEIDQPRSSNNRSNMEIDQPRSSNSRSNMEIDQPRSSSRCIKETSEDRNWWEISDKPSTSKGVRNESRQSECAIRIVPQYFEDLFEEEPSSEIQRKLLNYNIPSDKFDCIHKYIHK